jgi:tRNA-specific 2-thiouridylase
LLRFAERHGAELFATGHYARLEKKGNKIILKRPIDIKKDQSYVLSMLPKKVFNKLIFPIGDYTKEQVREIARKAGIKVHQKPSNQDLCFLNKEKGDFIEWWTQNKLKPGNIVDVGGKLIGQHQGLVHYTIGQRRGLGLKGHNRYYVKAVKPRKNELVVGEENELYTKQFYVKNLNWISIEKPKKPMNVEFIVRNKMLPQKAKIIPVGKNILVIPKKPVWAVSPGQIAVFIKKDIVLGGGWII